MAISQKTLLLKSKIHEFWQGGEVRSLQQFKESLKNCPELCDVTRASVWNLLVSMLNRGEIYHAAWGWYTTDPAKAVTAVKTEQSSNPRSLAQTLGQLINQLKKPSKWWEGSPYGPDVLIQGMELARECEKFAALLIQNKTPER